MPWYKVDFSRPDYVGGLMNQVPEAYRAAGMPDNFSVYVPKSPTGGYSVYFSPGAAALVGDLLTQFRATECPTEPDLTGFKILKL